MGRAGSAHAGGMDVLAVGIAVAFFGAMLLLVEAIGRA